MEKVGRRTNWTKNKDAIARMKWHNGVYELYRNKTASKNIELFFTEIRFSVVLEQIRFKVTNSAGIPHFCHKQCNQAKKIAVKCLHLILQLS